MQEKPPNHTLSRDMLVDGTVQQLAMLRDGEESKVLSPEALAESRRAILPDKYHGSDIWVFGYGSLIWNPLIEFAERIPAQVFGFHKRFCLWTRIGRGSPECPGLVLALDRGGSVRGHAFRIRADIAPSELDILWKREMLSNAYAPRWLQCRLETGKTVNALGFVIRRDSPSYAGKLTESETAHIISKAAGFVGPCWEYLFETERALQSAGFNDSYMRKLSQLVRQKQQSAK